MDDYTFLLIIAAVVFIGWLVFTDASSAPPAGKKKRKLTDDEKDKIAIEALSGKIEIENLAKREGITPDEVKAIRDEFIKDADKYSRNRRELDKLLAEQAKEINWFKNTCARFIGSDWEEKTEYNKRNR